MRTQYVTTMILTLVAAAGLTGDAVAAPIPACTAANIIANDSGCPASGACNITKQFEIGDGCVLDFGTRAVTLTNSGELLIDNNLVTLRSGNFTVAPGALVDGRTTDVGGVFTVAATGNIDVQRTASIGKILVNGDSSGGTVVLGATGNVTIAGQVTSTSGGSANGSGGSVRAQAGGNIVTTSQADVDVHGGDIGCGGEIDFVAVGTVDIGNGIDVTGGDGGVVNVEAGGLAIVRDFLKTNGQGDAGSGGCIDVVGGSIELNADLQSTGAGSTIGSGGGCGGAIYVEASFGNAILRANTDVTSGGPDGGAGCIEFFVKGNIDVQSTAQLISEGTGGQSCGGEVILDAEGTVTVNGPIKASGGDSGGCIEIAAGRTITVNQPLTANGRSAGSFGGSVTIEGAIEGSAPVTVNALVDAGGAACDSFGFCSLGGDVDVAGCDVTIGVLSTVDVKAPGSGGVGGGVFLTSRKQLTVAGTVIATGGTPALDGSTTMIRPTTIAPIVTGTITPAPIDTPRAHCAGLPGDPVTCLDPCPVCGNGTTEFPETCDMAGTPVSCDGCSAVCQTENCNDNKVCTTDSCDPVLGCRHVRRPIGTPCLDATVCNGAESCNAFGNCIAGPPLNCNDMMSCTVDTCNAVTGCQHTNVGAGLPCSDGNACTNGDTCNGSGTCIPGPALDCNDNEPCTADSCNTVSGCVNNGTVTFGNPCADDGVACTADICAFGACAHGHFPPTYTRDGASCDDGNPCTVNDTCLGGVCQPGGPVTCTPLDQCHDAGTCSPLTGCSNPPKTDGTTCNDGSLCTSGDNCQAGACTGNAVVCTALDQCHDPGTCNPGTGICSNPNKPNGSTCTDTNLCTQTSVCQGGTCVGSNPIVCTPLDQCHTAGTCAPATGLCSNPNRPNGAGCSDGNLCTQTDSCQAGICTGANPVVCTALNQCHDPGTCSPATGVCSNPDKPDGTTCTDGNACTTTDSCQSGVCTGTPGVCGDGVVQAACGEQCDDDGNAGGDGCSATCAVETCYLCTGQPSVCTPSVGSPCDDGDLCTNDDVCGAGGTCVGEDKPRADCREPAVPGKALLRIKNSSNPNSRQVLFKWIKGTATTTNDFGNPAFGTTDYSLCVYDEEGDVPGRIFKVTGPAQSFCSGDLCWKQTSSGYSYKDRDGSRGGLQQIQLKAGPGGKAKAQARVRGLNLVLPSLGLSQDTTVTAQLVGKNAACFEAEFSAPARVNSSEQFRDKAD